MSHRLTKIVALSLMVNGLLMDTVHAQPAISRAPPTPEELALFEQKQTDFSDFKTHLFELIKGFDRDTITQSSIESIMGVRFLPNPEAKSFELPESPSKKVALTYKTLKVQQYILPVSEIDERVKKPTLFYGFENYGFDFPSERDKCLSLHELKAQFPPETVWQSEKLGIFYVGLRGTSKGVSVMAFIDDQSFYMPPSDELEANKIMEKLNSAAENGRTLDNKTMQRLNTIKANIDGCVFILDLF